MVSIKNTGQRIAIFWDVQNLYHSAKNLYDSKVDFNSIAKEIIQDRTLIRSIGYVITTEEQEESSFLEALNLIGIETKGKDLIIFNQNNKKADWDVGIVVDMITMADKVDVIVLVSGDSDFVPAVEYLKMKGCQVEVVSFGRSCATKLRESADIFIDLCEFYKKYILRSNKITSPKRIVKKIIKRIK